MTDEEIADRACRLVLRDLATVSSTHADVAEAVRHQVLADLSERPSAAFDSRADTLAHIGRVRELMAEVIVNLTARSIEHDASKLMEPEKSAFDRCTPLLAQTTYGTPEYEDAKAQLGDALAHHYDACDHHPEHELLGIHGMNLLQLIELLADWRAAGERHADGGNLQRSIIQNAERFGYDDTFANMLLSTARELGWI